MWYRTRFHFSRNSVRSYELNERLTVTVNSHGKRFSDRFSALLDWSVRQIKWSAGGQPSAPRSCNYVRQMKFPTEWSRGARYWASAANYDGIVPARAHVRLETQQSIDVTHSATRRCTHLAARRRTSCGVAGHSTVVPYHLLSGLCYVYGRSVQLYYVAALILCMLQYECTPICLWR